MTRYPLAIAAATLLVLSLAGCSAPATDTSGGDTGSDTSSGDTTTSGGGASGNSALVTLAGSGDYTVGVGAPIGSYELTGKPSAQPSGCTWALEDESGNTIVGDTGPTLEITDKDKFFQTSGCPDWVQTK